GAGDPARGAGDSRSRVPSAALALYGLVGTLAVGGAVLAAAVPVPPADLGVLALLLALEVGYVEVVRLGRLRHRAAPRRGGLGAVVVVAGALLLAPAAAVVLSVVGELHQRWRLGRTGAAPPAYGIAAGVL